MMAWFSGCLARPVQTPNGVLTWSRIEPVLRPKGPHNAPTTLISIENTHNIAGGTVYLQHVVDEICAEAHARGFKVHMDGARVFNAAIASDTPVSRIVRDVDTVMFCLSKGLGAPVGSMLAGSTEAIAEGRLYRKRLGGGMRQAGVLAAAGLVALQDSPRRLAQDHANARFLAERLANLPGIEIDPARVQTNIVVFDISALGVTTANFSKQLRARGILANGISPTHMRMVTHLDVTRADCERAIDVLAELAEPQASNEHEYTRITN
jgi:threonine aldolase